MVLLNTILLKFVGHFVKIWKKFKQKIIFINEENISLE